MRTQNVIIRFVLTLWIQNVFVLTLWIQNVLLAWKFIWLNFTTFLISRRRFLRPVFFAAVSSLNFCHQMLVSIDNRSTKKIAFFIFFLTCRWRHGWGFQCCYVTMSKSKLPQLQMSQKHWKCRIHLPLLTAPARVRCRPQVLSDSHIYICGYIVIRLGQVLLV
jgi:hypothetical protein